MFGDRLCQRRFRLCHSDLPCSWSGIAGIGLLLLCKSCCREKQNQQMRAARGHLLFCSLFPSSGSPSFFLPLPEQQRVSPAGLAAPVLGVGGLSTPQSLHRRCRAAEVGWTGTSARSSLLEAVCPLLCSAQLPTAPHPRARATKGAGILGCFVFARRISTNPLEIFGLLAFSSNGDCLYI